MRSNKECPLCNLAVKTILQDRANLREQHGASSGHFLSSEHDGGSAKTLVAPSRAMPSGNKNLTIVALIV